MSIASKLEYLDGTKDYIRQCIQQKGVTVPAGTTFREYGDKILEIETEQHPPGWEGEGGGDDDKDVKLTTGIATATGQDFVLTPPEEYDGFSSVAVTGDYNLKPENIAEGITIYGVTGTLKLNANTSIIPSAYLDLFEQAKQLYNGDYKNLMILESDDTVAFGFLLNNFTVTNYDPENTEFYASGWVYVAYNKNTKTWKMEPWQNTPSNGNSYCKNIRYCDMYVYYGTLLIYPMITVNPGIEKDTLSFVVTPVMRNRYLVFWLLGEDLTIDYGDGTEPVYYEKINAALSFSHEYTDYSRSYTVNISGSILKFYQVTAADVQFLTPLPSTLISLEEAFYCNQSASDSALSNYACLSTISPDIFSKISDPEYITSLYRLFYAQYDLLNIPSGLFNRLFNVRTVASLAYYCKNLTTIGDDLFYAMSELTNVSYAFSQCRNLQSIPSGLFSHCPKITAAQYSFQATAIKTVPSNLFASNSETPINAISMFVNCEKLIDVPMSFFDNFNPSNMTSMFSGCISLQSVPEIWNMDKFSSIPHGGCFAGCTELLKNMSVPSDWR